MDYIDRIEALGACAPALDWLRSEQYPSLQAAWDACPRSNWMLWLLSTVDHPAYPTAYVAAWDARVAAYGAARDAADAYAAARDADAVRTVVPVAPTLP